MGVALEFSARQQIMDEQQERWEDSFARKPGMSGDQPSDPARKALQLCHGESVVNSWISAEAKDGTQSFLLKMEGEQRSTDNPNSQWKLLERYPCGQFSLRI